VLDGEGKNALKAYLYADEKQYFQYSGDFVDAFQSAAGSDARLFVNDNADFEINSHHMLVKNSDNEILGVILPVKTPEEFYKRFADILPLDVPYKTEYERIKDNPTNDPYIGKEYTDGENTYLVARLADVRGKEAYQIHTVTDGELSRHVQFVPPQEIEQRIALWAYNRETYEKHHAQAAERAREEAEARAIYENTNGFADNQPPMQKARVLSTLDKSFNTKDYGNLNTKTFIETAVKDGKKFEAVRQLKNKYHSGEPCVGSRPFPIRQKLS
jgi:hypothetical protein